MTTPRFADGIPAWSEPDVASLEVHAAKSAWQASEGVPIYLADHYSPEDEDAESCGGPCRCGQRDANAQAARSQQDRDAAAKQVLTRFNNALGITR